MKNIILKIILALFGLGTVASFGTNLGATEMDMKWVKAYDHLQFETADGDLGLDEYAVMTDKEGKSRWWVRKVAKDKGNFEITTEPKEIEGKTEVTVRCENCASYSEWLDSKGEIYREAIPFTEHEKVRTIQNYPQPKKTETVTLGQAVLSSIKPRKAYAAPTFDATAESTGTGTSLSFSHTVTGTNTFMIITLGLDRASSETDPNGSCTYNSVAVPQITEQATNQWLEWHELVAPTDGANTAACTWTGTGDAALMFVVSYTGVDQADPSDTPVQSGGTQTSETDDVTSATGDLVVDAININSGAALTGGDQTERAENANGGNVSGGISEEAGAATVTMSWSWDATSQRVSHISVNLNAVAAAGGTPPAIPSIIWFNED